jgi:DNA (cytosine-5)-methyltransferase 3A
MRILSLFDGMACGMIAFKVAGVPIDSYDAYEIDKFAVQVATHNFPEIREHGDVFDADFTNYEGVDYVIGGSPCTYWSIAQSPDKRETTASGIGWELFSQYVRAIKEAKQKYFIYENNKSMAKAIYDSISATFGFEPIMINSALVSAQNRERYYWVGKRNEYGEYDKVMIEQPGERGITMSDIIESGKSPQKKGYAITHLQGNGRDYFKKHHTNIAFEPVQVGILPRKDGTISTSKPYRIYATNGKGVTIQGQAGGLGAKTGLYAIKGKTFTINAKHIVIGGKPYEINLPDGEYAIRPLTASETKKMQTVPEWYEFPCSDTAAQKMLGNGWTIEVIAHLIKATQEGKTEAKQLTIWEA